MNKAQLADAIAEETGLSKVDARKALDAFIKITGSSLKAGDKVTLVGFGSFIVSRKPVRTGRDFRTGAPIRVPAKEVVAFRPGSDLNNLMQ